MLCLVVLPLASTVQFLSFSSAVTQDRSCPHGKLFLILIINQVSVIPFVITACNNQYFRWLLGRVSFVKMAGSHCIHPNLQDNTKYLLYLSDQFVMKKNSTSGKPFVYHCLKYYNPNSPSSHIYLGMPFLSANMVWKPLSIFFVADNDDHFPACDYHNPFHSSLSSITVTRSYYLLNVTK